MGKLETREERVFNLHPANASTATAAAFTDVATHQAPVITKTNGDDTLIRLSWTAGVFFRKSLRNGRAIIVFKFEFSPAGGGVEL